MLCLFIWRDHSSNRYDFQLKQDYVNEIRAKH